MPELAEVEFYRKQWSCGLSQAVGKVSLHPQARVFREADPTMIRQQLKGSRLETSHAHGKMLLFRFTGDIWLGIHLGMSGALSSGTVEMVPSRHEHLVLHMVDCSLVLTDPRMFGRVRFHQGEDAPDWWSHLPPQPQEAAFDRARFLAILKAHPRQPLKALLLDQSAFPGIGNWMADEILWQARIHPARSPYSLSPYKRTKLFDCLKCVCQQALLIIGADWSEPPQDWLFLHRWKRGGTCPVSGKPLVHETIGGRTTCISPAIQK